MARWAATLPRLCNLCASQELTCAVQDFADVLVDLGGFWGHGRRAADSAGPPRHAVVVQAAADAVRRGPSSISLLMREHTIRPDLCALESLISDDVQSDGFTHD